MSVEHVFGRIMTLGASLIILAGTVSALWVLIAIGVPGLNLIGHVLLWIDLGLAVAAYAFARAAQHHRRRTPELLPYWQLLLSTEERHGSERRVQMLERGVTACWVGLGIVLLWLGLGVSRGFLLR